MWIRKGVRLLEEIVGDGASVERQANYLLAIRVSLNRGDVITRPEESLGYCVDESLKTSEDGYLQHHVRIDRESLIAGVFYAVLNMKVGGYRKVSISPHLAYGEDGVPDLIPPNAKLIVEIKVLGEAP